MVIDQRSVKSLGLSLALAAALVFGVPAMAQTQMSTVDQGEIVSLLMAQFDRPDSPLTVEPVSVAGETAIAGWRQGDMGGRAFLRREADGWQIVLCAGEEVLDPVFLSHHGLDLHTAHGLVDAARGAESGLGAALIERLDSFDGVVLIAAGAAHGHGEHQTGHAHGGHAPAAPGH